MIQPRLHHVPCNLCGADIYKVLYPSTLPNRPLEGATAYNCTNWGYGKHHRIVQCRHCGLVYANPRYVPAALLSAYEEVIDPLYEQERDGRVLTFHRHLAPIERLVGDYRGQKILDVGAYTGVFVEIAAQRGWEAWGTELSLWAVRLCQERGLNVIAGTLEQAAFPDNAFKVVTAWDVVEHLDDPQALLREIYRVTQPGGWAVIHTIDIDAPFARLMGARWPWLMEMHLTYFSRRTLAAMLEQVGFRVRRAVPEGRYQRLSYLVSRLRAINEPLWRVGDTILNRLHLSHHTIPVNLGDLVTTYAQKPIVRVETRLD